MKMYTIVTIILMTICIAVPGFSQMNVGVIGGINLANMSLDPEQSGVEYKNEMKYGVGAVLQKDLGEKIALQVELLYLGKGTKGEATGASTTMKIALIELPILIKYDIPMESMTPSILVGPTIGYILSAEAEQEMNDMTATIDMKDDLKSLDIGIVAGLGVSVPMGKNTVFVQGTYTIGLVDLNDNDDNDTSLKTKGIQVLAGISMPLGE